MYCIKCGIQNADDALFCKQCGASLKFDLPEDVQTAASPKNSGGSGNKKKLIGIIIGAVAAAVAVIVLLMLLLPGGSWEKTLNGYMKALTNGRIKKAGGYTTSTYYIPKTEKEEELIESYGAGLYGYDLKSLESELNSEYDMTLEEFFDGMSYEIISSKKCTKAEIDSIEEILEDDYSIKGSISDAVNAEVKVELEVDEAKEKTFDMQIIKINGKWYVYSDGGCYTTLIAYMLIYDIL